MNAEGYEVPFLAYEDKVEAIVVSSVEELLRTIGVALEGASSLLQDLGQVNSSHLMSVGPIVDIEHGGSDGAVALSQHEAVEVKVGMCRLLQSFIAGRAAVVALCSDRAVVCVPLVEWPIGQLRSTISIDVIVPKYLSVLVGYKDLIVCDVAVSRIVGLAE